jgi:hypothetical protein
MIDSSLLLNVGSLIASLVAVAISVIVSARQSRLAWSGNHIPLVVEVFGEFRSGQMHRNEQRILERLSSGSIPEDVPFSAMPDEIQDSLYSVCHYYQMVAYLVFFGVLDRQMAYLALHFRVITMWRVIEPHVYAERTVRGDPYSFLNAFELLADFCRNESSADMFKAVVAKQRGVRSWI